MNYDKHLIQSSLAIFGLKIILAECYDGNEQDCGEMQRQ
jgi:hypothetical protein